MLSGGRTMRGFLALRFVRTCCCTWARRFVAGNRVAPRRGMVRVVLPICDACRTRRMAAPFMRVAGCRKVDGVAGEAPDITCARWTEPG